MAEDGGGDAPRNPTVEYRDYPKDPDHYVEVTAIIPGLSKKIMKSEADNAEIKLEVAERSFSVHVIVNPSGKKTEYLYKVNKLPEPIETDGKTYYKVKKKGEVSVYLCKVHSGSWAGHLSKGLDMDY